MEARPQEKGLETGPVLQGGDWALVLPTFKLVSTSLLSPENFVQIGTYVQKLFMIFQKTDGHTAAQMNNLCTIHGYGWNLIYPVFSTFSLTMCVRFACSHRFVQDNFQIIEEENIP